MNRNLYMCLPPFLTISIFLFHIPCTATQENLVQKTCTKCAQTDPNNINLNFCLASLQESPQSNNLRHLGLTSIHLLRRNLTETKSRIERLLKNTTLDPFMSACLQDCLDLYSDAVPATRKAVRDFKANRFGDANAAISSVMDASTTCEDGFHEREGVVSPLTRRNDDAFRLSALSLCIINMFTSSTPLVPIGLV